MYNYVTREQQNTFGYHLQPKFRKIGSKNCDLLDLFEEGIAKEKLHKIELRKDAMMLLRIKQKYDIISQHFAKYKDRTYGGHKKSKFPVINILLIISISALFILNNLFCSITSSSMI